MQLLKAAGLPPIGNAFPRNWENTIRDANPAGFYESDLRQGIYYATNPHPKAGVYLFPEQTRHHSVKVFIPGLIKTDRAFIDKVVATVRPWRQYVSSVTRLYTMERDAQAEQRSKLANEGKELPPSPPEPVYMPPALEWWAENFSLVSDIVTRRYPVYMLAYESVLTDTETTLGDVFAWLGEGDATKAVAEVEPTLRTQKADETPETDLEQEVIDTFDAFYEMVLRKEPLDQSFVDRLNTTNDTLAPRIGKALVETTRSQQERKKFVDALRRK